jgi:hypothetical protein
MTVTQANEPTNAGNDRKLSRCADGACERGVIAVEVPCR